MESDGCPPAGPFGASVGDTVHALTLYDCDGNEVSLHDLCPRRAAAIYTFAEWCPTCRNMVREDLPAGHSALAEMGDMSMWVVLTATSNGAPVDASQCRRVRDDFGLDRPGIQMLYDPGRELVSSLGMRVNAGGLILARHGRIMFNDLAFWSTIEREIVRTFGEVAP